MSSEPWNLGSEKSNATLQLRQDYIYDALNAHLIGSEIVDATTFAAFASYLGYGSGGSVQDMQVAWTPSNLKLGEKLGFFTFGDIPGITSITFDQATSIAGFDIESTTQITSLSWPNLVTIDPTDIQNGYVTILGNSSLTAVSMPVFSSTGPNSNFGITGCSALTSLSFPSMTSIGRALLLYGNTALVSISAPSLTTVGQFNFDVHGCTLLTTVTLTSYLPTNGVDQNFIGCALSAASVNHILARCVASVGYISGTVNLSGGTNAAPSGQGIADKATLIGRGVNVITN